MALFYDLISKPTAWLLLKTMFDWQVQGQELVPKRGPVILVANHVSQMDPPVVGVSISRRIVFIAKEELRGTPAGVMAGLYSSIIVRRGKASPQAMGKALRLLEHGGVLGIFPEGTRGLNAQLGHGEDGAAFLALKSGAPVLPVGITGTQGKKNLRYFVSRPKIRVTVGKPLVFARSEGKVDKGQLAEATRHIMQSIAALLPEELRGVYGSQGIEGTDWAANAPSASVPGKAGAKLKDTAP